jgi:GH25 family lysozyme M1 (1,4-beta-N-acetylmuramidase)
MKIVKIAVTLSFLVFCSAAGADITQWMIDISSHNRSLEIQKGMKFEGNNSEIRLIIHRATVGTYNPPHDKGDPLLARRAREAHANDILFGAYHVAYPNSDAATQAEGFINALKAQCVPSQKLVLAVDWEYICTKYENNEKGKKVCVNEGLVPPDFIVDFLQKVEDLTGKPAIVYTSSRTLRQFQDYFKAKPEITEKLRSKPLWIARYRSKMGTLFPDDKEFVPWADWTFWQFGEGKGVGPTRRVSLRLKDCPVDTNYYNGGRGEIDWFFNKFAWDPRQSRDGAATASPQSEPYHGPEMARLSTAE